MEKDLETLMHSDTYLGLDFSNDLAHWKYIKKERKNGRWVYYYKDEALDKLDQKKKENQNALKYENNKRGYGNSANGYIMINGKKINDPTYNKLKKDVFTSEVDYGFAKAKSDKRKKVYNALIKTLNGASSTISKGKSLFKKLFG